MRAFDCGDRTTLLGSDGAVSELSGDSALLVRAILEALVTPLDRDGVLAHLGERMGEPVDPADAVDEALALLRAAGAVVTVPDAPAAAAAKPYAGKKLVLGLTGAVATCESPGLVKLLQSYGFVVRVALTSSAARFVTPAALEALTHERVVTSLWAQDATAIAPHIRLAQWADVVLVCPATATTLARLAQGDCSDVVWATAIATRAPVILVPGMNSAMYTAPSVQRNLEALRGDGFHVVHPAFGYEVADAPEDRTPEVGPPPPWSDVAVIVAAIVSTRAAPLA